jgi:hypothetical protein
VTFAAAITALSTRFLTERSFELIVAPALADFELDAVSGTHRQFAARAAVLSAFSGAVWEDAVRGGDLARFAGLVLIPVCYYTFFFLLGLPGGVSRLSSAMVTGLAVAVVTLSFAPALVCFWPERQLPRSADADLPPSRSASARLAATGGVGGTRPAPQP